MVFVAQLLMSPGLSLACQPIFEVTSAYVIHEQVAAFILMLHADWSGLKAIPSL